jgi:hypothetical protein
LPRRAISSTLAENLLLFTNKPDYLANIIGSAIRPGQLEAWTKGILDDFAGRLVRRRSWAHGKWESTQQFIRAALERGAFRLGHIRHCGNSWHIRLG